MANVDDARNSDGRFERELAKVEAAAEDGVIVERDRAALVEYAAHKRRDTGSIGTVATYLNRLRTTAERAETPLVDFERVDDVAAALAAHEDAGATATSTLDNYRSALRQFFAWLDDVAAHGHDDYGFRTQIRNSQGDDSTGNGGEVDPGFVLSVPEVDTLQDAATDPRERALVAFLADTGRRVSDACEMRCGDVTVEANTAGSFRRGDDDVPLHGSEPVLRRWLGQHHPEAPDPPDDAPLFPVKRGYEPGRREEHALSPSAAADALKRVADAAGIDSGRVRPKNWRRFAVLRMYFEQGLDWDAVQSRTGLGDSSMAESKQIVRRVSEAGDELKERWTGFAEDSREAADCADSCIQCGSDVPASGTFCPQCGADQSRNEDDRRADLSRVDELQRQRDQIALLTRLNRVMRGVNEELLTASDRASILDGVADRLANSQLYDTAWATEESLAGAAGLDEQAGRSGGGFGEESVVEGSFVEDQLAVAVHDDRTNIPVDAGSLGETDRPAGGPDGPEMDGRWTTVPVVHGRTIYGTLALFSTREDAFSRRELAVLDAIGRQVGHAVNAAEKELLLVSDSVTELRIGATGGDPLAVASQTADATITAESIVPTSDDDVIVYCAVDGDIHEVVAALSHADGIARLRPIDESTIECHMDDGSLVVPLREVGAQVEQVVAEHGSCTVVARVAPEADVRTIVSRIQRSVPGARLEAKRQREGGIENAGMGPTPEGLVEDLTERQRETLTAAYEEGYFEWPRESTAQEVAEEMDVTSPTVHNHLRKAENEMLGELLGDTVDK